MFDFNKLNMLNVYLFKIILNNTSQSKTQWSVKKKIIKVKLTIKSNRNNWNIYLSK